jgi:hypothetical protein
VFTAVYNHFVFSLPMPPFSFFGPQQDLPLSEGSMKLPCHFRKVHYSVALFAAERERVSLFLEGKGLVPALPWGGRNVMIAMGLIAYEDSDLGAYNEVIVAVPCVREGGSTGPLNWTGLLKNSDQLKVGMHILHIPVTTERSRIAGAECWGYPKKVLPIEHRLKGNEVHTSVVDEQGRRILQCTGSKGPSIPIPSLQLMTYSFLNGAMLRTPVQVRGGLRWHPVADVRLTLGDSNDIMAKDLHSLGLDGAKAKFFLDAPGFQAVFGAGVKA